MAHVTGLSGGDFAPATERKTRHTVRALFCG
jgi:hypothetical protein